VTGSRLSNQLEFLIEADKLKQVLRRTTLTDGSRLENSAEHSWHLAVTAIVLTEYSAAPIDLGRVLQLIAVHDLVEIDAGDTFAYDMSARATKAQRELEAADRIFGLLTTEIGARMRALWDEFEASATPEARYAQAVDRIQPFLQNCATGGGTWREYRLSREAILSRMEPVQTALPRLWPMVLAKIEEFSTTQP
jgi:putative hydrolase of HD superfamily